MNLIEAYIKEIHSEKRISSRNTDDEWIEVDITIDEYGRISKKKTVFPKEEWKKIKEEGQYLT